MARVSTSRQIRRTAAGAASIARAARARTASASCSPSTEECRRPSATSHASRSISCDTDSTSLFWGNVQGGQIQKVALQNPQAPMPIAQNQTSPHGVSTDGKNVYWSNAAMAGTINKTSMNGGNVTQLAASQTFPDCTAVDATSVYWINLGGGMISKTAK